jgi:hypothetical protein
MAAQGNKKKESIEAYKDRLKKCAMSVPVSLIRKALLSMKQRALQVVQAEGGDIPRD